MQTYVQYRVCEGPLPNINILKHLTTEPGPTCFLLATRSRQPINRVNADDLLSFLETYGDTPDKLHVLLFWSKHPRTRCTLDCVSCTPEARRFDLRRAVRELVQQQVLVEAAEGNTNWYSLTPDPEKRASVENLGNLSWDEIRFWSDYRVVELTQEQASS
ncbi:MAG: hypothetical protein HYX87_05715 [Chloroflexi bacterium]|nr:hypothetical protein [Chloroflexota bacterium]